MEFEVVLHASVRILLSPSSPKSCRHDVRAIVAPTYVFGSLTNRYSLALVSGYNLDYHGRRYAVRGGLTARPNRTGDSEKWNTTILFL